MLGAWTLQKHRNSCVFDGESPCLHKVAQQFMNEAQLWSLAGAKKLQELCIGRVGSED
ncbi:hypothetical protein PR202_gb15801 [Eleusine coracana subsp. coracana]|uniref:Uncharacterized protein n=1 Tax=Eleusine coracana subsp. coracana TaxID=191504 RepID=A0AAV5EYT9_ELECO|nr:hypothetical protein PR202_gb15801 [Eleusine coracana subsp. coracana]